MCFDPCQNVIIDQHMIFFLKYLVPNARKHSDTNVLIACLTESFRAVVKSLLAADTRIVLTGNQIDGKLRIIASVE